MVWKCYTTEVDSAFTNFDRGDGQAIVAAALQAGYLMNVTITKDMGDLAVPKSYREAMASRQSAYWRDAIANELAGLVGLKTWRIVPIASMPNGANLMNCHFVFAVKRNADGSIEKFKARLVADGNTQKHGVDFDRVFSSVVKTLTIRLALIVAAACDYNLSSIDIRQAYLQAELKEDLFMRIPPGIPWYRRSLGMYASYYVPFMV